MSESVRIVACPTCKAEVRWEPQSRYRPFCSERCRLIDLGQWASETYRMPAEEDSPPGEMPSTH